MAAPMPRFPPVTIATLPTSLSPRRPSGRSRGCAPSDRRLELVAMPSLSQADLGAGHLHAAVDGPHLTGDVARGVGREEVHDARHLVGATEPGERDLRPDLVEHLLRHAPDH